MKNKQSQIESTPKVRVKFLQKLKAKKLEKKHTALHDVAKMEWLPNHYQLQIKHLH